MSLCICSSVHFPSIYLLSELGLTQMMQLFGQLVAHRMALLLLPDWVARLVFSPEKSSASAAENHV